jgi:3-hydroxyacyl-[acyl-carrier-protein] dehydratase
MTTVTEIRIAVDHPAFAGHFPDMPVVPGAVLIDEALHAIACVTGETLDKCTISSVKFKSIVRPGQSLILQFERVSVNSIRFEIRSQGQTVTIGNLTVTQATGTSPDG